MNLTTPQSFLLVNLPTGPAWFRREAKKPILTFWQRADPAFPLSKAVGRHPDSRRFIGRGTVVSAPFPTLGELVVRPCVHGGGWGRLARDLYFGASRVHREIQCATRLEQMGIPTPKIQAVLCYPVGPLCRLEVVTSFLPQSQDLAVLLSSRPSAGQRSRIFSAVRQLLAQCHRHGVRHPDLNIRNILLEPTPHGRWTAWLLDVDTVTFAEAHSRTVDTANRNRLLRSLLKRARHGDLGWSETEVPQLWNELFPRR